MNSPPTNLLAEYPVIVALPVQWGDQDAIGHVNNTVYFRWFESSRVEYMHRVGLGHASADEQIGPILARVECDFRRQVNFPDEVEIGTRVAKLGRTSIIMRHAVASRAQQTIVAEGESVLVVFDYAQNQPHPIPDPMRQGIAAIEGR